MIMRKDRKSSLIRNKLQSRIELLASLLINVAMMVLLMHRRNANKAPTKGFEVRNGDNQLLLQEIDAKWNGGHPMAEQRGSCYCSPDNYCMCSPIVAIYAVIVTEDDKLWLVQRKDTDQLALMGGFVVAGETAEDAVRREMNEVMNINLEYDMPLQLMGVYSDPRRDRRRHIVSTAFIAKLPNNIPQPWAGDDAKSLKVISMNEIEQNSYFADHKTILMDYKRLHVPIGKIEQKNDGDFTIDVRRSTCESIVA